MERGAKEVHGAATHAVLSGPAVARLSGCPEIKSVVVSDTIPLPPEKRLDKLQIFSVAPLLAAAIDHIHRDESVSVLLSNKRDCAKRG
jgi:ribose-phosphate pyrophosphokinase